MHEFNVIEGGKSALLITNVPQLHDISALNLQPQSGWVSNNGFQEIDIATGKVNFEWNTLDHVPITESTVAVRQMPGEYSMSWDYM